MPTGAPGWLARGCASANQGGFAADRVPQQPEVDMSLVGNRIDGGAPRRHAADGIGPAGIRPSRRAPRRSRVATAVAASALAFGGFGVVAGPSLAATTPPDISA